MRRRYLIGGRVQGVGFRFFSQRTASRLGLLGWVRNLPDGRVELEAQGDPNSLTSFESALRQGPRGAQVAHFEHTEISDEAEAGRSFLIR
ncbi:MAG TPA: acylphosphatase [Gemmatimonadales bacterium]|nr:acylphosphatase [Gemmatimonadales bacterium]